VPAGSLCAGDDNVVDVPACPSPQAPASWRGSYGMVRTGLLLACAPCAIRCLFVHYCLRGGESQTRCLFTRAIDKWLW